MNKADATNYCCLRPNVQSLAANVHIAVIQRLQHLRQGQPILVKLVEINCDLIGLSFSTPTIDINYAGYRLESAFKYPILNGFQIRNRISGRSSDTITVDFADRAFRRNGWLRPIGQRRQLSKAINHPLL